MSPKPIVTLADQSWIDDVAAPDSLELRVWDVDSPIAQALGGDADRVVGVVLPYLQPMSGLEELSRLSALRHVQALTAGYDNLIGAVPQGVSLSNAAGVHDASTAELAVGLVLASLRGLDEAARNAATGTWDNRTRTSLADRRVLLVGVGGVGSAIAARLAPFEVELTRVGSRARVDAAGHVHGIDELPSLLPAHDVVIVVVPLSEGTRHLINDAFLAAMPGGALLVNVARGPVADTDALVRHTDRLHLALDVVDPEPLPADHPLWRKKNVLISPHVGGNSTAFRPRAVKLIERQLQRIARGNTPDYIVIQG